MNKDIYDAMITFAHEDELPGILYAAAYDFDITPVEFMELSTRVNAIKEKCEEIGK